MATVLMVLAQVFCAVAPAQAAATLAAAEPSAFDLTQTASPPTDAAVPPPPAYADSLQRSAETVLNGPDFHRKETSTRPVMRDWLADWLKRPRSTTSPRQPPDFSLAAQILKVVVVVALLAALAWLILQGYRWLVTNTGFATAKRNGPVEQRLVALTEAASQLPDDIGAEAARAWQAGQPHLALSLLYRGAVAALARRELVLPEGATEGDYLRLARARLEPAMAGGFAQLVAAWTTQAYANRGPQDFASLLALYRQHFDRSAA